MKLKITRKSVIIGLITLFISMLFITFYLFNGDTSIFNDTVSNKGVEFGWIHYFINTVDFIFLVVVLIYSLWEIFADEGDRPFEFLYDEYKNKKNNGVIKNKWSFKRNVTYVILILFTIYGIKLCKTVYNESIFMYNTSKLYHNTYNQKVEEKQGFYDKLWKTYLQKDKITNINKETFIAVTKIIMENRRDGQQLMWKWVHENQQIPYDEFTKFYSDLSVFITEQREGYFNIEKECQLIANKNNILLDTFPNNIYNKVLKLNRIKFEYGFLSDSTNNVFKNKMENIK